MFFGSALTNFGLEPFLQALVELAPPPQARAERSRASIAPDAPNFTGFVFKIQANMDPRHRDRVAFVRVCSGVFKKDMVVTNARAGRGDSRVARRTGSSAASARRSSAAYPGDIVGLVNPGQFAIGDTLYAGAPLTYPPIPRFPAEHFGAPACRTRATSSSTRAMRQLEEEGLMQVLFPTVGRREPILGASVRCSSKWSRRG